MQQDMKNVSIIVTLVSLFAFFYQISPYIGVPDSVIAIMFFISPVLLIYMVYVILKYGKKPKHTFEERFYEDVEN